MTADNKPETTVTVEKRPNGKWCFVVKYRGVTHPAQGSFTSMLQAQAVGQSVLKALEQRS